MGTQLELFKSEHENLPQWRQWWELHDWTPEPGVLCCVSGRVVQDEDNAFLHFFIEGYILQVNALEQTVLAHFPQVVKWRGAITGTVAFRDTRPVTRHGFNEAEWRQRHPLPEQYQYLITGPGDGAQPF